MKTIDLITDLGLFTRFNALFYYGFILVAMLGPRRSDACEHRLDNSFNQSLFQSSTKEINQIEDSLLFIPNAFTPDGDYLNDVFNPGIAVDLPFNEYLLQIYNRWGEVVFESKNPLEGWDGSFRNMQASSGSYLWKIELQLQKDEESKYIQQYTGQLNLLR